MHKTSTSTSLFPPQHSPQPPADASSCPIATPSLNLPPTSETAPTTLSKVNPLNHMPNLSQDRSSTQATILPTSRTTSSIPRGDTDANWEYPSPQQMYNAMLRKGYDDTPEDAVESMVAVHNFLNEGAWKQIEGWEARFSRGLGHGWQCCKGGEGGFDEENEIRGMTKPKLSRFMGRPGDMTPKAKMFDVLGRVYPAKFGCVFSREIGHGLLTSAVASRLSIGMIGMWSGRHRGGIRGRSDMSSITTLDRLSQRVSQSSTWMYGQRSTALLLRLSD